MFSIVIPLYNKAHTIVNTLQTVLNQTYTEFEVVIVNDGSTDNGVEVIEKNFTDSRIRIVNQINQGVSIARNRGVEESKNEYIAFLDGDDELLPEFLTKMKESIAMFPHAGMYCCAGILRYSNGKEYLRIAEKFKDKIQEINYFENPYFFTNSSSTVITKSGFNKTTGFPAGMRINEDLVFFCSLSLVVPVVYCPIPLSVYLKEVEGQASANNAKLHEYVISRTNLVFENWLKTNRSNNLFLVFTRYEIRNEFMIFLRSKDYAKMNYLFANLDGRLLKFFPSIELKLFKIKSTRPLAIIYLYFTKFLWKLKGYPVIRYKIK